MKVRFKLRLVAPERPLAALSMAEKRAAAIAWLRARNRYVLDADSRKPSWGIPYAQPQETPLMKAVMESDRRRR